VIEPELIASLFFCEMMGDGDALLLRYTMKRRTGRRWVDEEKASPRKRRR